MRVKGTAFMARKALLQEELGADGFEAFFGEFVARHPDWPRPILATSTIPIDVFLALNDAVVERFFDGDELSYWRFGRQSAEWALIDGPYRRIREERDLDRFVASAPSLYRNYFTEGSARSEIADDGTVHLWIEEIPREHHHVYFEYAIVGYFERGLALVSDRPVEHERLEGFSAGDERVHYRYRFG
ncbi:MAG TPA: hypothetical protein RMH99_27820 [Sandaracinaceae bacterium LLY-WYZ-13_1]|nr:hypothetical protein [Sandaracinaceae bacterium LLY-WYZ-13_1]